MREILEAAVKLAEAGEPVALVTVVATEGSTPRKAGARMLVRADGRLQGTVGGGKLEADLVARARECLASGRSRARLLRAHRGRRRGRPGLRGNRACVRGADRGRPHPPPVRRGPRGRGPGAAGPAARLSRRGGRRPARTGQPRAFPRGRPPGRRGFRPGRRADEPGPERLRGGGHSGSSRATWALWAPWSDVGFASSASWGARPRPRSSQRRSARAAYLLRKWPEFAAPSACRSGPRPPRRSRFRIVAELVAVRRGSPDLKYYLTSYTLNH